MGVGFVAAVAWIGHAVRYNDRWLLTVNAVVLAFAGYGLIYWFNREKQARAGRGPIYSMITKTYTVLKTTANHPQTTWYDKRLQLG